MSELASHGTRAEFLLTDTLALALRSPSGCRAELLARRDNFERFRALFNAVGAALMYTMMIGPQERSKSAASIARDLCARIDATVPVKHAASAVAYWDDQVDYQQERLAEELHLI
jgi:hypothetical protein